MGRSRRWRVWAAAVAVSVGLHLLLLLLPVAAPAPRPPTSALTWVDVQGPPSHAAAAPPRPAQRSAPPEPRAVATPPPHRTNVAAPSEVAPKESEVRVPAGLASRESEARAPSGVASRESEVRVPAGLASRESEVRAPSGAPSKESAAPAQVAAPAVVAPSADVASPESEAEPRRAERAASADAPSKGNEAPPRRVLSAAALAGRLGASDVCLDEGEGRLDGGVARLLLPRLEVRGRLDDGLPTPDLHGRTLHPGDEPSEAERVAEAEARVTARVDAAARDALAQARVTNGLVDPYFGDLRRQLAKDLEAAPDFTQLSEPKHLPRALYDSWKKGAEAYGKTGVAYEAPVRRGDVPEIPTILQREMERGSADARLLAMKLVAGARLRDFADGKMGVELYAEVAVVQGPGAALEELSLVRASGVASFDAWVVERAGTAVELLGRREATRGLRSVWGFTGRVKYWRSTKDLTLEDDAWYLALMALPGLATGRFDPVAGTAEVVDLRHPHYECTVELVRVY